MHQKYFEFLIGCGAKKALSFFHVAMFDDFNLHDILDF